MLANTQEHVDSEFLCGTEGMDSSLVDVWEGGEPFPTSATPGKIQWQEEHPHLVAWVSTFSRARTSPAFSPSAVLNQEGDCQN